MDSEGDNSVQLNSPSDGFSDGDIRRTATSSAVQQTLFLIHSDDPTSKVQAAKEIRRLTKTSQRYRRHFSNAVKPLVDMLRSESFDSKEAALLALLNLAVKDEGNKINIINAGALEPIIGFLQSENATLQDHATASLLTLSVSPATKPIISASGVFPMLVEIIRHGSSQAKADAVMALSNLSTYQHNLLLILRAQPIPSTVSLLKSCKKSSKTTERCTSLIESLMCYEEGRNSLISEDGGVLAVVEVLESGSAQSREHAVGALLTMCQSDRSKYREPILREGVIPGLLELTVQGTVKSRTKAQTLLRLLRDTPYPRSELEPDTLENIVSNLISQIDCEEQSGKAKEMLAEMVQVSMEQSLRHLQQRALLIAEVVGTYFLIFAGCGSVVVNKLYGGTITFPGICVTWGLIVMVLAYTVGHVSGAHFNPAVTITFSVFGRFPWKLVPLYIIAQLLGSILASGTLALMFDLTPQAYFGTVPAGSDVQSLVAEILISFLLMFVICGVGTDDRAVGHLSGVAVGMTITLNVFVTGPISGASMNPARSIGPALVRHVYKGLWVYIVGPVVGTLAGAFVYNLIRSTDKPLSELTKSVSSR